MSISSIQHHLSTACYYDNACQNKHEKALESINSNLSVNVDNLISEISHIENSPIILNLSSTPFFGQIGDMATPLQLMLLFNVLHRSDITSFAYKEHLLSIMGNDASLAKPNYFIGNSQVSMSLSGNEQVSFQPLGLPEVEQGETSYANSNSTRFINENSHILSDD